MSRSIKVVFFDAANTLFHIEGSVADIYLRHALDFGFAGGPNSLAAIEQAFGRALREAPPPVFAETDPGRLKQSERLWWFDIVHNVFYRVGMFEQFDKFFEQVFRIFEDHRSWRLFPETLGVLTGLRTAGLELGIISNFDSRLFPVMRGLGIDTLFDTITISSLSQAAKPAPKIFRLALEKHAADPEEGLHVGDSLRDDVEGAINAGLHAVLLDRAGKCQETGIRSIGKLDEVLPLIDRL